MCFNIEWCFSYCKTNFNRIGNNSTPKIGYFDAPSSTKFEVVNLTFDFHSAQTNKKSAKKKAFKITENH